MNQKTIETAFEELAALAISPDAGTQLSRVSLSAGKHEKVLHHTFAHLLSNKLKGTETLDCETAVPGMGAKAVDITIADDKGVQVAIEVKAPMTNHDGVRSKTRKPEHLLNDCSKLRQMQQDGGSEGFELVGLIETYGLTSSGQVEPAAGRSIRTYETEVSKRYRIKWPTRYDYKPVHGRAEVERVLMSEGMRQVGGWKRCPLPSLRKNASSYLDLALFRLT